MSDSSRKFFVTKFACSACGSLLSVSYDKPNESPEYCQGEPTGAYMVQSVVTVHPCTTCLEPVRKVKEALKVLISATD